MLYKSQIIFFSALLLIIIKGTLATWYALQIILQWSA